MTETIPVDIERFKYHLSLRNRFAPLAQDDTDTSSGSSSVESDQPLAQDDTDAGSGHASVESDQPSSPQFFPLPEPFTVNSEDIDVACGYRRVRKKLERRERRSIHGRQILEAEKEMSERNVHRAINVDEATNIYIDNLSYKDQMQHFYYSNAMIRIKRSVEITSTKYRQKICSGERKHCRNAAGSHEGGKLKPLIMFIGDRGFGVGSRIKGHLRYGGKWKQAIHGLNTPVCVTNEEFTSQTCVYCFSKVSKPVHIIKKDDNTTRKTINGAFLCTNSTCISVQNGRATQTRDSVSALAIALKGLSTLLFGETMPEFRRHKISQFLTDFILNTSTFLTRSEDMVPGSWADSL